MFQPSNVVHGHALELSQARFLCGATFRLGAARADGSLDTRGFVGGTADMIASSLRLQAPWLAAVRAQPRASAALRGGSRRTEGTTQLMRAAAAGDERRVRELLAAGAARGSADGAWGRTALHWAAWQRHEGVIDALLGWGCTNDGEVGDSGDAANAQDRWGETPLMRACFCCDYGVARALLARGARLDPQAATTGWTALHVAAGRCDARMLELLCAAPGAAAALKLEDVCGRTPLTYAHLLSRGKIMLVARGEIGGPLERMSAALHCFCVLEKLSSVSADWTAPTLKELFKWGG